MNLDLGELQSFVTLADTMHFGRAAEQLHISQPALTKQIQRLEARCGGPLIDRRPRRFALTPAGALLRKAAQRILAETAHTEKMVRLAMEGRSGLLRLGFGIATLGAGLAALLREHRRLYPLVEITLRDMATSVQLQALDDDEIDVGFVRQPLVHPHLKSVPLFDERLVVALPSTMRPEEWTGLQSMAEAPFIGTPRHLSPSYQDHFLRTCQAAGFTPHVVQEAAEFYTILHLVGIGMGVALVPRSASEIHVPHVSYHETLVDAAGWQIGITWRERELPNPLVENFVRLAFEMRDAKTA